MTRQFLSTQYYIIRCTTESLENVISKDKNAEIVSYMLILKILPPRPRKFM